MIAMWLWACHGSEVIEMPTRTHWEDRVTWAHPDAVDDLPVATLPAEVAPRPGSTRVLGPPTDARLVMWLVRPGEQVSIGQGMAELRSPELSDLDAATSQNLAALREAQAHVDLVRSAVEGGVAARGALREAEAALATARAESNAGHRRLAARQDTTTDGVWRSPADGVVASIQCEPGAVKAGDPCVTLVDPMAATLYVALPERYVQLVSDSVYARFADGDASALALTAASPVVDRQRRVRDLWFAAPSAPMGSIGRATLWVDAPDGVTVVPEEAVTVRDGVREVFVRNVEGLPRAVEVEEVGRGDGVRYVVGLDVTDEIAVRGVFLVKSLVALEES